MIAVLIVMEHVALYTPLLKSGQSVSFLPISSGTVLLNAVHSWLNGYFSRDKIYILCKPSDVDDITKALPSFKEDKILVEPDFISYSTSICYASMLLSKIEPKESITFMPVNMLFSPSFKSENWIYAANEMSESGYIVIPAVFNRANEKRYPNIDAGKFYSNSKGVEFFQVNKVDSDQKNHKKKRIFGKEGHFTGIIIARSKTIIEAALTPANSSEEIKNIAKVILGGNFNWDQISSVYGNSKKNSGYFFGNYENKKYLTIFLDTNPFYLDNWDAFFERFAIDQRDKNLKEGYVLMSNCRKTACFNYDNEQIDISDADNLLVIKKNGVVNIKSLNLLKR